MDELGRARLSLEGLSVGDAFGEQLLHAGSAARSVMTSQRAAPAGRSWMWTDDTAMALSIVEVLAQGGGIDPGALAMAFVLASDTVPFAVWCAATHLGDYAAALWACGDVGGDIDTTCAMVGGIVVGAVGLAGIPADWHAAREPLPTSA